MPAGAGVDGAAAGEAGSAISAGNPNEADAAAGPAAGNEDPFGAGTKRLPVLAEYREPPEPSAGESLARASAMRAA